MDDYTPFNIAAYVISMMDEGNSRELALDSAVLYFDLDGETFQKVLKELEPLEREYKVGLAP